MGFVTALNASLNLKPIMLLKVVPVASAQVDITTTLIYKKC